MQLMYFYSRYSIPLLICLYDSVYRRKRQSTLPPKQSCVVFFSRVFKKFLYGRLNVCTILFFFFWKTFSIRFHGNIIAMSNAIYCGVDTFTWPCKTSMYPKISGIVNRLIGKFTNCFRGYRIIVCIIHTY